MKDPRPGPDSSRGERMDEARRFGFYLLCAMLCFCFTFVTAMILIFRRGISFDADVCAVGAGAVGIIVMPFAYFGAMRKHMVVIAILRVWTVVFLTLQSLVFIAGVLAWLRYGVHNPAMAAADSFLAAGLSLIGLFFGLFGLIRGIKHRWFAHVLVSGYVKGR